MPELEAFIAHNRSEVFVLMFYGVALLAAALGVVLGVARWIDWLWEQLK